jgi:hypothetical protein
MQDNMKTISLFALAGILSGIVCWAGAGFLENYMMVLRIYPGVVLGIFLSLCGTFIARIPSRHKALTPVILIAACIAGWRLAVDVGYAIGGPVPYVTAGLLGAFTVALGWLCSWKVRYHNFLFIVTVALSGAVGGLLFQLADQIFAMKENVWALFLFIEWQAILLIGIAVALRFRSG